MNHATDKLAGLLYGAAYLRGRFVLRSGQVSDRYFDKYRFEADPILLRQVAERMVGLLPDGVDALAGLELGGIPLATTLSQVTALPTRFVRKQPKEHGTRQIAEGGEIAGMKLCVVEDVVTSGGQVLASCAQLRAAGAELLRVVCVVDREAGGREALAEQGLDLRSLFTLAELERNGSSR